MLTMPLRYIVECSYVCIVTVVFSLSHVDYGPGSNVVIYVRLL